MTTFLPTPNADGLVKLSGTVRNLKVTRANASFVFTESDQAKMGVVAVASAIAGLGGQAIAMASNASAMEEEADYLEFDLDGLPVKGWVWRNPFNDGDDVCVAAERKPDGYWEAFGVQRPHDKTVALYPHCSRGRVQHFRSAAKWWLIGGGGSLTCIGLPVIYFTGGLAKIKAPSMLVAYAALMGFFGIMTISLSYKWMPFVRLAEKVFRALDIPNPSNVDLVKSSKKLRTEHDPGEFGTFFFRY
jgi:hypothetical protein